MLNALEDYLQKLRDFRPARLLYGNEIPQAGGGNKILIVTEGGVSQTLEFGHALSVKEFPVRSGGRQPFAVSEAVYQKLFENLESLAALPALSEPTPAVEAKET